MAVWQVEAKSQHSKPAQLLSRLSQLHAPGSQALCSRWRRRRWRQAAHQQCCISIPVVQRRQAMKALLPCCVPERHLNLHCDKRVPSSDVDCLGSRTAGLRHKAYASFVHWCMHHASAPNAIRSCLSQCPYQAFMRRNGSKGWQERATPALC